MISKSTRIWRKFHNDESGESSVLSNVMLLAVAALAVVALIAFGRKAMEWLGKMWDQIAGEKI
jgi:Flp pilus assembly pilin Flp